MRWRDRYEKERIKWNSPITLQALDTFFRVSANFKRSRTRPVGSEDVEFSR
ncbi:hypothetical protein LEP1GSC005_1655 [Leptospira santarosai str. ST188]|nr:hypothetical protein LEP1GSC005_1655 [Leptospira santarosai str. ST188]